MKKISVLLAFLTFFLANVAFAQGAAVVASLTGTARVQTGAATPRTLRQGDEVRQGDTVSTAANSSVVLKFDDGEIVALTQNSRMTITAYQYERTTSSGNMLLSLVTGGMRAVTGLLGHTHPERVAYRAATATIGIRGTDVTIVTDGTDSEVTVKDGSVTVTVGAQTVVVSDGQTYYVHNGTITTTPPPGFNSKPATDLGTVVFGGLEGTDTVGVSSPTGGNISITNVPGGGGSVSPH
jgi:hypothetical protein